MQYRPGVGLEEKVFVNVVLSALQLLSLYFLEYKWQIF